MILYYYPPNSMNMLCVQRPAPLLLLPTMNVWPPAPLSSPAQEILEPIVPHQALPILSPSPFIFSQRLLSVRLALLLLLHLQQKRSVDVRQHTTEGDGGTDEGVELLITTNGQLQMAGSDTLDLEILGRVASKLENFSCQVFQNGGDVDGSW